MQQHEIRRKISTKGKDILFHHKETLKQKQKDKKNEIKHIYCSFIKIKPLKWLL